eukprot:5904487-Amphidinium_carterae.1
MRSWYTGETCNAKLALKKSYKRLKVWGLYNNDRFVVSRSRLIPDSSPERFQSGLNAICVVAGL